MLVKPHYFSMDFHNLIYDWKLGLHTVTLFYSSVALKQGSHTSEICKFPPISQRFRILIPNQSYIVPTTFQTQNFQLLIFFLKCLNYLTGHFPDQDIFCGLPTNLHDFIKYIPNLFRFGNGLHKIPTYFPNTQPVWKHW